MARPSILPQTLCAFVAAPNLQVMTWQSFKRFCDLNFPDMKFKNDAQRRSFLLKKNMKFQKDDKGVEGVCVPKNGNGDDEKEIKVGKRLSSSKIRQEDYGDGSEFSKDQLQMAQAKNSAGLAVQAVSQDWLFGFGLVLELG